MGGMKRKGEQKKKAGKKMNKKGNVAVKKGNQQQNFGKKIQPNKKKGNFQKMKKKEVEKEKEVIESDSEEEIEETETPVKKSKIDVEEVDSEEDDDMEENDDEEEDDDEEDNDEDEEEVEMLGSDDEDDDDEEELPKQPKKVKKPLASAQTVQQQDGDNEEHSEPQPPSTRLFITNLSKTSTSESVTKFFESNQLKLTDLFLPSRVNRSYAFAEVENLDMANKAISLTGQTLDGSSIKICFAKPRRSFQAQDTGDSQETNILFVKGLSSSTTKEMLEKHFTGAGDIRVMTNVDGSCKGHAFIEYSTAEAAKAKKDSMVGSDIDGSKVVVDFAAPRGANRFSRGGFNKGRRGQDFNRGGNRGGYFRGNRDGAGKSFGGARGNGNRFGQRQRGGFRGGNNQRGSFRGNRGRGSHVNFNDD